MFNEEEEKLEQWKDEIEKTEVTEDQLGLAIKQGFERAKNMPIAKKRPYVRRGIWSAIVAAILLLTLVTSIRVSPAFASAVASIPGLEKFVEFIQDDKGISSAIENEYYQKLNISAEKEGVTLTLDGVMADELEMVVFYTVNGAEKNEEFQVGLPDITDRKGIDVTNGGAALPGSDFELKGKDVGQTGQVNIRFIEGIKESDFIFKAKLKSNLRTIDFEIPFTVDKGTKPTKEYLLNEVVLIEGQKVIIKKIEITPIKIAIHIGVDPANTKKIFGFEDLRLVDEKGETWTSINNGITSSGDEDDEVKIYYLQSNYFVKPRELYLQFNKLMAMNKNEAFLLIDTEKEMILQQPKDRRFSNLTVNGKLINMDLRSVKGFSRHPFYTIIDATGKEIDMLSGRFSPESEQKTRVGTELPDEPFVNPIKISLSGYPQWIEGDVKIQIK